MSLLPWKELLYADLNGLNALDINTNKIEKLFNFKRDEKVNYNFFARFSDNQLFALIM
jgi:hypothetical protein